MENIEKLQPRAFTRFCMSIGAVPSSYLASLSYEEQLLWFCSYLEKTVIPAVNNNAEAVEELQALYTQLKTYVDNYFDNLDVQEEINNKLDEMAESGELEAIIGEYLQLAGILAYNTKAEMKAAENLVEGSIARTLGTENYNDGYGYFYKIRDLVNTDVIDDDNIIALHDPQLVAEKIIKPITRNYYLGAFHKKYEETDKRTYLFISNDAYNFSQLPEIELTGSKGTCGDPSIIYDKNSGWFLIAYSNQNLGGDDFSVSFSIYRSKDLKTFENVDIRLSVPQTVAGYNKWAPDLFYDKDGKLKVIITMDKTWGGYDFELLISEITDIDNLTFSPAYIIEKDNNNNIYDGSIVYYNNLYYLIASNYTTSIVELYTSSDLENFTQVNSNLFSIYNPSFTDDPIEGCQMLVTDNKILCYAEMHDNEKFVCGILNSTTNTLDNQFLVPSLYQYKHGSVIKVEDEKEKYIINSISTDYVNMSHKNVIDKSLGLITLTQDTTIDKLTIIPDQVYKISGNYNLTINDIKDPFNCREIKIIPNNESGKLTINAYNGDTSYTFTTNFSNYSKNKIITINAFDKLHSDNYSNVIDITNDVVFDSDFLTAFSVHEKRFIIKNGILFYNLVLRTNTTSFSKSECITLPITANVGCISYIGSPGTPNYIEMQINSGSSKFNINFTGNSSNYIAVSNQVLVDKFN